MSLLGESKVEYIAKIVGIHAALLHTGKLLLFSYPSRHREHSETENHEHGIFGSASHYGVYEMIDPQNWTGDSRKMERNIFCGGHCFLGNGDLFVSGGQYQAIHNPLLLFDPPSICNYIFNSVYWKLQKRTLIARWYPTCVTLPNGNALIISGATGIYGLKNIGAIDLVNRKLELFDPNTGLLTLQRIPFRIGLYPFMHALPNNRIFVHSERTTRIYNHLTNCWVSNHDDKNILEIRTQYEYSRTNPVQGTSVLLPIRLSRNKEYASVMIIGGGGEEEDPKMNTPATATCEIIVFDDDDEAVWNKTASMNFRRVMPDAIILPNGKILVVNGCEKGKSDEGENPVLVPELYDPENKNWTKMTPMNVERLYHSNALLLPDARVMTAGTDKEWNKGENIQDEYRIDVFTPPYLQNESRPEIQNVKEEVQYSQEIVIECDQAEEISSVCLIRPSSVTHSLNTDQRFIELQIISTTKSSLTVKIPSDPGISPKGFYMLFILNRMETPSKAKFLKII
ncbi:MAG: galactose oxidase-like domain-containing protein [Nitrososphaeraceae archaeon]